MACTLQKPPLVVARARGFTLVELMIVVIIVAILALLAVVGYRKIVQSSHVTEATSMVNNIRVAQEAYHAETQTYAPCMASLQGNWYPASPVYSQIAQWGDTCKTCQTGYDISLLLPVHVDGPVMFGYSTVAGGAGLAKPTSLDNNCNVTVTIPNVDYFGVAAEADLDGNPGTHTDVCAFSFTNQIFVTNEGL
jgi:type IV pilus assembly protein PilA